MVLPLILVLLPAFTMPPRVGKATLAQMVEMSDEIVVGRIAHVHLVDRCGSREDQKERYAERRKTDPDFGFARIAEVEVQRRFEGDAANDRLYYYAQSTWLCDVSTAIEGETVLLFLGPARSAPTDKPAYAARLQAVLGTHPLRMISHSGYGRLPARTVDGKPYWTLNSDKVGLPDSVPTIEGPEARYSFIRSTPSEPLLAEIERLERAGPQRPEDDVDPRSRSWLLILPGLIAVALVLLLWARARRR